MSNFYSSVLDLFIFIFRQEWFQQIFYDVASALSDAKIRQRQVQRQKQKHWSFCIFQINIEGTKREQLQFTVKLTACDRLDKLDIPHIFQIRYRAK